MQAASGHGIAGVENKPASGESRQGDHDQGHPKIASVYDDFLAVDIVGTIDAETRQARLQFLSGTNSAAFISITCPDRKPSLRKRASMTTLRLVLGDQLNADRAELAGRFATKVPRMEFFYRDMRRRHRILVDTDDSPVGGV